MEFNPIDDAVRCLEKANANLEPELLSADAARGMLAAYARAQRLAAFGVAALARKIDDAAELARTTGTSIGKARETVTTGKVLGGSAELNAALQQGDISLDQATEIARAEESSPGAAKDLVTVAQEESFNVLKEKARKAKLEAEQHNGLGARQHAARYARSYSDELGMVNIHLSLEPHVGTRSSPGPRPRPPAWRAPRRRTATVSPSSDTSPTVTPRCCPVRARAGRSAPSSSCW